jgi:hypothetical protein
MGVRDAESAVSEKGLLDEESFRLKVILGDVIHQIHIKIVF